MQGTAKRLVVLVGPKGAGKSTLGRAAQSELALHFFDVEHFVLAERERRGGPLPVANHAVFLPARGRPSGYPRRPAGDTWPKFSDSRQKSPDMYSVRRQSLAEPFPAVPKPSRGTE